MRYLHFTVAADGFAGHMAEPEEKAAQAVIIVMGGEKGLLPGIKIAARYIPGIDNLIMVSPSHVPFEGTVDKKLMTGHSFVTWRKEEIPYVRPDFSRNKAMKYSYDARAERKVMGMWNDYMDAYENKERELQSAIPLIGLAYRQFRTHKKECMQALEESEREIIRWMEEDYG